MSVYVQVSINGDEFLTLQVRRVTNTEPRVGGTPEDEMNTYEVRAFSTFRKQAIGPTLGVVEHRYGDGMIALSRKALEAFERLDASVRTR